MLTDFPEEVSQIYETWQHLRPKFTKLASSECVPSRLVQLRGDHSERKTDGEGRGIEGAFEINTSPGHNGSRASGFGLGLLTGQTWAGNITPTSQVLTTRPLSFNDTKE